LTRRPFLGPEPFYKTAISITAKGKKIVAEFRAVRVNQRVPERLWLLVFAC
jgi:hypothetical protein